MKNVGRLVPVLTGILGAAVAWGASTAGCSGNNSTGGGGGPDATADGEADSQADTSQADTTQADTTQADTVQADTFQADSGSSNADAQADTSASDADAGPDVYDASAALAFPGQLAAALCDSYASCCGTSADAAAFNWTLCYNTFLSNGFHGSDLGANYFFNGNMTFNPVQAQACLNAIGAVDCVANQVTAAEEGQLYQSCYSVYAGTLGTGAACYTSMECAPGHFCEPPDGGSVDGGPLGFCQPLAGVGGSCGILSGSQQTAQTVCSYLGSGTDGLFCQNVEPDADTVQLPKSQWTCQAQWANGSGCYVNSDCTSLICLEVSTGVYQCANAGNWATVNTCNALVIADAGGGG